MRLKLLLAALVATLFGAVSTAEALAPEPLVHDAFATESSDTSPIPNGKADRLESGYVLERSASQTAVDRARSTNADLFFVAPQTKPPLAEIGPAGNPGALTAGQRAQYLADNWHSATFPNRTQSIN